MLQSSLPECYASIIIYLEFRKEEEVTIEVLSHSLKRFSEVECCHQIQGHRIQKICVRLATREYVIVIIYSYEVNTT